MQNYPQDLIEQYLRASNKLKKFERIVFKRFAPSVTEVQDEFARLAVNFENASIPTYAAMCHLGVAKCENPASNAVHECYCYLRAARCFLQAENASVSLLLRSSPQEYREGGAIPCYRHALEHCADDSVLKAAIIRELTAFQPHCDADSNLTSNFNSPAHGIYELELSAYACIESRDFLAALRNLDDIVDNIQERKKSDLYGDLLRDVTVLRFLLLIALDLPPARQSPDHLKLIEYFQKFGNFEIMVDKSLSGKRGGLPGAFVPIAMQEALGEIAVAWCDRNNNHLKLALDQFLLEFISLNAAQRFVVKYIYESLEKD